MRDSVISGFRSGSIFLCDYTANRLIFYMDYDHGKVPLYVSSVQVILFH